MTRQELMNECDYLNGNINRMMVTDDPKELLSMYEWAERRLQKIYQERVNFIGGIDMADELNYVRIEVSRKMVNMDNLIHNEKTGKDYARIVGPEGSSFTYPTTGLHVVDEDPNKIYFTRPEGTEIMLRYSERVEGVPDDAPAEEKYKVTNKTVTVEDLKEMYAQDRAAYRDRMQGEEKGQSQYVNMTVPTEWGRPYTAKESGKEMVSVRISVVENGEKTYWSFVMPADRFKESEKTEGMSYFGFPRHNKEGEDYTVNLRNSVKGEDGQYTDLNRTVTSEQLKELVDAAKGRYENKDRFINIDVSEKLVRFFPSNSGNELAAVSVPVYPDDKTEKAKFYEIVVPAVRIKDIDRDGMVRVSLFHNNPDGKPYEHTGRHSEKDMETGEYVEEKMTLTSEDVAESFRISAEKYKATQESTRTLADEMNQQQDTEYTRPRSR